MVRQEHHGFGAPRPRTGVARAASHNILLFLDSDMLAEADWITMHARWHHAVSDALTLGVCNYMAMDGIDAETIRHRKGSLHDLFVNQSMDPPWLEGQMIRANRLDSRADDLFRAIIGGNFGTGANTSPRPFSPACRDGRPAGPWGSGPAGPGRSARSR